MFAYGATGAGKTFTMLGSPGYPGITFLTMMELYQRIQDIKDEKLCDVRVSYLEVRQPIYVANSKCHHRLNEILIFLPALHWEIRKVVYINSVMQHAHAWCPQNLTQSGAISLLLFMREVSYSIRLRPDEFSCKQLCWFPGCVGKKNLDFIQSLVAFWISNICYW